MPDTHAGYGMPVGGVLATDGYIIPNAVGVDIGCGMRFVPLSVDEEDVRKRLDKILHSISRSIPMGFHWFREKQDRFSDLEKVWQASSVLKQYISEGEIKKAGLQLGTLGGGNHFIEIQKDDEGRAHIMIHSGSRNLGKTSAEKFHNIAFFKLKKEGESFVKDLAYLDINSEEGKAYIEVMQFCMDFAKLNREAMTDSVLRNLKYEFGKDVQNGDQYDIHHNYASLEEHLGKKVWVHRKGATAAFEKQLGIIPGSMGTPSYIVQGKGNEDSFKSCSHGSGRTMSRTAAFNKFNIEDLDKSLQKHKVVLYHKNKAKIIDEGPYAYKNIEDVIDNQKDLIDVVTKLYPIGNLKG
jgi:tRNA-splicing ligase RtcB